MGMGEWENEEDGKLGDKGNQKDEEKWMGEREEARGKDWKIEDGGIGGATAKRDKYR